MAAAMLPAPANLNKLRRTETRPLALARSMISLNCFVLRRRSMVRVLTPKNAAISSSVHCIPQSFSSSAGSIWASGRAIRHLSLPGKRSLFHPASQSFGFDLLERPAVRFKCRRLAREVHEALTDHIAILRVQLNQSGLPSRLLAGDQCGPGSAEDIENRVTRLAAVANRALNQLRRLHGRVLYVGHGPFDEPHIAL